MQNIDFRYCRRILKEKFYLYIYLIVPSVISLFYICYSNKYDYVLSNIATYEQYRIEISISLVGVFLTLLGLFTAVPNSRFKYLLKRYKHNKIFYRTLFIGIFSGMTLIVLALLEILTGLQEHLFIWLIAEVFIATIYIFNLQKALNKL